MTRLEELEQYLAETDAALAAGDASRTPEELRYIRSQTLRRIDVLRQHEEGLAEKAQRETLKPETPADGG